MTALRWLRPSWWVRDPSTGHVVLWQRPNVTIATWWAVRATSALKLAPGPRRVLDLVGRGALVVWAADELVRGSAPYRRVLGAVVLASQIARMRR